MKRIGIFLAVVLFASTAFGQTVDEAVQGFKGQINDAANIFSQAEENQLQATITNWEKSTGNEFAVLTVNSTGNETAQQFALQTFIKLGVGKKDKDNGLLLLVAVKDRKTYLSVGRGLEGVIPDGRAGALLNDLKPHFRAQQYYAGVSGLLNNVIQIVNSPQVAQPVAAGPDSTSVLIVVAIVLGVIILIGFVCWLMSDSDSDRSYSSSSSSSSGVGPFLAGAAVGHMVSSSSKSRSSSDSGSSYTPSYSSPSYDSSPSFSFGGGDSGGGGAGGDW